MSIFKVLVALVRTLVAPRAALAAENLALRQRLVVLQRSVKKPRLRRRDRVFWVWLSLIWSGWRSTLVIVRHETVLRWHRAGFRLSWRWKSRRRSMGRPNVDRAIRDLVRRSCRENPVWGAPWTPPSISPRCVRVSFVLSGPVSGEKIYRDPGDGGRKGDFGEFFGSAAGVWTIFRVDFVTPRKRSISRG
jgi:hypothetical protein